MAGNTLLTISEITYEAARILVNNLVFTANINRGYDEQFARRGAKIGDTINIRKPPRFIGRTGPTVSIENITETYVPLTLSTQFGVDMNYTSSDLTLSMDNFSDRYLKPAVARIANKIDEDGLLLYKQVPWMLGTPGVTPNTFLIYAQAAAQLSREATPMDENRSMVLESLSMATIVDANKGLFQSSEQIREQYEKGRMGISTGFTWYEDQNVITHQVGPLGGTPTLSAVPAQGATTLATTGWTAAAASRLKQGDIFTLPGVYQVNPQNRRNTGQLREFVVTADFSSDGSGNGNISIYPAIQTTGAFQTCSALPASNAALTVFGSANTLSPQDIAFHRDFAVLGMADLELPRGVHEAARVSDEETGVSIRMISAYDVITDLFITRLDVLYGFCVVYPELAVRIAA